MWELIYREDVGITESTGWWTRGWVCETADEEEEAEGRVSRRCHTARECPGHGGFSVSVG